MEQGHRYGTAKRIISLLISLAFGAGSTSRRRPALPTEASCPSCVFGKWGCQRSCPATPQKYTFDFRYAMGQCWEEIPKDARSMIVDVDLWCSMVHTRTFLSCSNMHNYDTSGIALLEDCKADALGADLVQEACIWACKNGRPVARCLWQFGHAGRLADSRLRHCWLAEACSGGQTTDVRVICEPYATPTGSADVASLQTDLASAIAAHSAAEAKLIEANAALSATGNHSAQLQTEKDKLKNSEEALYLARDRLSGVMAELEDAKKHLEGNTTLHHALNQSHAQERDKLQDMVDQAARQLNKTRHALRQQTSASADQSFLHNHVRRSLIAEIARFKEKWQAEQDAHLLTQSQLKSEGEKKEEAKGWLALALVALGFVVILCLGCLCFLNLRARKWRVLAISSAASASMGAQVVLGRPVATGDNDAEGKGVFAESAVVVANPKLAWS